MVYRRKKRLDRTALVLVFLWLPLILLAIICTHFSTGTTGENDGSFGYTDRSSYMHISSRHLLGLNNCTPPAIDQFPRDYFSHDQRRHGAFVLHVVLAAYMFLALALVCDDYFVPSCERCCNVLKLQEDVAGATFMAAGSSAPELATAVIGVFIAKDDIGLGAVVGSAVYNIMFVISLCALFAGSVVYLKWWPLVRDSLFYTFSIIALVLVIMNEEVHWYEALMFLIMYLLYVVLMYFNRSVENWIVPKFPGLGHNRIVKKQKLYAETMIDGDMSNSIDAEEIDNAGDNSAETACLLVPSAGDAASVDNNHNSAQTNNSTSNGNSNNNFTANEHEIKFDTEEDDVESGESSKDDDSPASVWDLPKSKCKLVLWVLSIPLIAVMFITVPDCRRPRWKNWFLLTLVLSIVWIGFYSYLMVWMITVVGHTWGIPDSVMGLTLIAAGSSVPDAIASLIVVRDGHGDMAVSNAIGSNVFDILLCLGLPWFLQTAIVNVDEPVKVYSAGLTYSALTLLSTVVLLLVATHVNGWRLTKPYGAFLMVIYILFNVLSCLYELNFFGYVHPADCLSKL